MSGLTPAQARFLGELFPGDGFTAVPEETCAFGADASRLFEAPWAVVRPESEEQVVRLMAWAQEEGMPLFPRARGTNVVGACVPRGGGVVVSTLRMNRILEIDAQDFVAVVQPGVVTADLQKELDRHGLMYPPDPASVRISTIGGNVATCAGGMRAVKYGVTRDYVLGVRAVLPGGRVLYTGGRNHKNVVGLDLARLFVGSEGTLGLLTEITLKLLPKPEATASVLAGWPDTDGALGAARDIFAAGILPAAMEFMERDVLKAVAKVGEVPWPEGTGAALLLRLDGGRKALAADLDRLEQVVRSASPSFLLRGLGAREEEPLWEVRRLINPASFKVAPDKLSDDITVPRSKVRNAVDGIRKIATEAGLTVLVFGHLGDGNLHVNVMHDKAAGEGDRALQVKSQVVELVLSLGGTMSGEHGVGLTKYAHLGKQLSPLESEIMHYIKKVFDFKGILNPGKGY
ncbi:FAD-binding oxidoreductase [Desulfovibrio ferrophilus]|uniref:D-lactate dehydrogenase n=1 Tax=Desulfovibrio ferrophilus TaxID=241368 RepID=A0A2Z6B029_9BACT|nr:FAD-linked oxidase C-terminal domain-containing protein [Desulfovibrio ferrophilus]BBD08854.1 D-lactate dehydrogenase [Desulfovibrio ferrophilus]